MPREKTGIIEHSRQEIAGIWGQYQDGIISNDERKNKTTELWTHTEDKISEKMFDLMKGDRSGFNPIYMMSDSGARGSKQQIKQLAGMRGLMAKPSGELIEMPIVSNFKEGLNIFEYFISTHGARKGLADTALKTAEAGYLTRRLVDIAQDVIVSEDDCGTLNGITVSAVKQGDEIIQYLSERIIGRVALDNVYDPGTGETLVHENELIDEESAKDLESRGVEAVRIRTVLTCECRRGVCRKCYGVNLATGRLADIGEAAGIIAAQSIGHPGTQLTMRTFHTGGIASVAIEQDAIKYGYKSYVERLPERIHLRNGKMLCLRKGRLGVRRVIMERPLSDFDELAVGNGDDVYLNHALGKVKGKEIKSPANSKAYFEDDVFYLLGEMHEVFLKAGSLVNITEPGFVKANKSIATFDPFSESILAEHTGKVVFDDIIPGRTMVEEIDPRTKNMIRKVVEFKGEKLQPRIMIQTEEGAEASSVVVPNNAYLNIGEGQDVEVGDVLVKIPRKASKTKDITSGLPRVVEMFEARKPKEAAVLAEINGTVHFTGVTKGKRQFVLRNENGREVKYSIPLGSYMTVHDGDRVYAGDILCEGQISPHDILHVKGREELLAWLVSEIQEVYRLQNVEINDKHVEIIVRQMTKKVEITSVGNTRFVIGQKVDAPVFQDENRRVIDEGGEPAVARPTLMGITKAALNIESFFSAASFQETTKVLTDVAIKGKVDRLAGLKENVIIGHPIPAGTGTRGYRDMELFRESPGDLAKYE